MVINARKIKNAIISPAIVYDDKELKKEYSKFCINRGMKYDFGTKIVCTNPANGEKLILRTMTIVYDNVEDFNDFCDEFDMRKGHYDDYEDDD